MNNLYFRDLYVGAYDEARSLNKATKNESTFPNYVLDDLDGVVWSEKVLRR